MLSRGSVRRLPARPSILAITSELPWPLDRGGHLRSFHLLRGLAAEFDVHCDPEELLNSVGMDGAIDTPEDLARMQAAAC